jgi:L,D-peptidoglycan transpeptidase YkuD (ErfK/YbiS/YcfS/YnhG family)
LCRLVVVSVLTVNSARGRLRFGEMVFPCALGRAGCRVSKREGDGATPIGVWRVRTVLYRSDRLRRPRTAVPARAIRSHEGWCDAPLDRNYNRLVRLPYGASAERLWRADALYDLIVVLGYNDRPRVRGRGSAIFMHVANPGLSPTEGCIALARPHLQRLLAALAPRAEIIAASGKKNARSSRFGRPEHGPGRRARSSGAVRWSAEGAAK